MKRFVIILLVMLAMVLSGCGETAVKETQAAADQASAAKDSVETKTAGPEQEKPGKKNEKTTETKDVKTEDKTEKAVEKTVEAKTAESKDAEKKAEKEKEEEMKLPEYTVSAFAEEKVMFASNPVNLRKGPTTDFERVGGLNRGQEVRVTGQADTGWYEIIYGEGKAYVSHHYLQENKPEDEPVPQPAALQEAGNPEQAAQQPVQAVTEVKNVAGVILVGDSRFVQMQANVGENSCTWIAEGGKGYNWFNEKAVSRVDGCVGKGSKILINLGVNDPGNLKNYLALVNAKAAEWVGKGARVYYASVNPVWENPYVTEEQVEYFNSQMQSGLSGDINWIDSHSYLNSIGYKLVDGLHYNSETYQNLYAYYMSCL